MIIDQSETRTEDCCGINIYIWGQKIYSRGLNLLQRRSGAERRSSALLPGSGPKPNKLGCQQWRDVKEKAPTTAPTLSHGNQRRV